jgi:pimeloyl-ACP methyl ester carboxylesterase
MPQIDLDRATIHYRVLGPEDSAHPPVVFVHGILVDHRLWIGVAEQLARKGFRCYLPDLPLGAHREPVDDDVLRTPDSVALLVHRFLEALDLDDVTLVGNDTGGGLCQLLIDARPERIGRLILTNCDAFGAFPPFPFNAVFAALRGPRTIKALAGPMRIPAVRSSPLGFGLLMRRNDELTASWMEPGMRDPRIARNLAVLLRGVGATDLVDVGTRLVRFTKPVTLVWGQADRCFTPALGRRLAAAFPDAELIEVPGVRTFVALDAPGAVVDAVERADARTG